MENDKMITNDLRFTKENTIAQLNIKKRFIQLNLNQAKKEYEVIKNRRILFNEYKQVNDFYDFIAIVINHEIIHNILLDQEPLETTYMLDNIALKYRREGYWL